MRQYKVLIIEDNKDKQFESSCVVSISKTDYDNLKLLKQYLPKDLNKKDFSEQEKEVISKYNSYIDTIKEKCKCSAIQIDFNLKKIKIG